MLRVMELWRTEGHRVLVFTQTVQCLDILEIQFKAAGYRYLRMDGTTSLGARATLVQTFNDSADVFAFLLTTRTGGVGLNLTGVDRVLIFAPDWNPMTDVQARERCWRIGQRRDVTIYRLLLAGTLEEKIYHRQLYKQCLSNKVLEDPRQKPFKWNEFQDLFEWPPEPLPPTRLPTPLDAKGQKEEELEREGLRDASASAAKEAALPTGGAVVVGSAATRSRETETHAAVMTGGASGDEAGSAAAGGGGGGGGAATGRAGYRYLLAQTVKAAIQSADQPQQSSSSSSEKEKEKEEEEADKESGDGGANPTGSAVNNEDTVGGSSSRIVDGRQSGRRRQVQAEELREAAARSRGGSAGRLSRLRRGNGGGAGRRRNRNDAAGSNNEDHRRDAATETPVEGSLEEQSNRIIDTLFDTEGLQVSQ
eukprot:GHVU01075550.1.p1 GENE.GHVU01075550.1~~GHVU01075550.1.p1  ORF type:complete len:422 (+),score=104.26 GHVU01075550.1:221-1486(+)